MSKEECEIYNLRAQDGEFDKCEVRQSLALILAEAKEQSGFHVGDEKVLIQIYPTPDGGCELFVTKLSCLGDRERKAVCSSDNLSTFETVHYIFRFECLDDLTCAARALKNKSVKCDVYLGADGAYYIEAEGHTVDGVNGLMPLYEFGTRLSELPYDVLFEHGRLLCRGDGIAVFSKL